MCAKNNLDGRGAAFYFSFPLSIGIPYTITDLIFFFL
jgi:hypothetical protein